MPTTFLRFDDLKARKIAKYRSTVTWLQKTADFPTGRLLGPNTRVWTEEEIEHWLETRAVRDAKRHGAGAAA